MFKKPASILVALASLTIGYVYAADPEFIGGRGEHGLVITHINDILTVVSANQSSFRASWKHQEDYWKKNAGGTVSHEGTFYLSNSTAFSGGIRSDAVKGRKIHVTYHFEGDRAIADTITFVQPNDGIFGAIDAAFKRMLGQ
jgi:hypothetical protein